MATLRRTEDNKCQPGLNAKSIQCGLVIHHDCGILPDAACVLDLERRYMYLTVDEVLVVMRLYRFKLRQTESMRNPNSLQEL